MLAGTFLLGSLGTGAKLLLLGHTEGIWQKVPLALVASGCLCLFAAGGGRGARSCRTFQAVMGLFVASGVAGIVLHYQGNVEFEMELNPATSGFELFWESMKGATPALAPGAMILLGAVGLAYAYCRPR